MKVLFLRRQGLGLDSIRNVISKMEVNASIHRVDMPNNSYRIPQHDLAINWGNTNLRISGINPMQLPNLVNNSSAVHRVSNKGDFRKKLADNGLAMFTTKDRNEALRALQSGKKLIIRPYSHFGGSNTLLVTDQSTLDAAIMRCGSGWYASEYIPKLKEFRVFVANGRAVYVVEKIVPDINAIAWNVAQGGRFENVRFDEWNLRVVKASIEAFNLTELDFGAVDVIVDGANNPYVLEINTAPALTSEYWFTCVAKVFDYIANNGKSRIPLITERGGWRKFIHPAMSSDAILVSGSVQATPTAPTRRTERRQITESFNVDIPYKWSLTIRTARGTELTAEEKAKVFDAIMAEAQTGRRRSSGNINVTRTRIAFEDIEVND